MAMLAAAFGATAAALQEEQEEAEAAERRERANSRLGQQEQEQDEQPSPTEEVEEEPRALRRRRGRGRSRGDSRCAAAEDNGNDGEPPAATTRPRPRASSSPGRSPSPPPLQLPRFRELGLLPSLVAGWSAFPSFALLVSVYLNATYLRFGSFIQLFMEEEAGGGSEGEKAAEPPSAAAVAFLSLRTLSLLFTARNALAMAWDFFVDSVRDRPILNPLLFRNVADAMRITGFDKQHHPTRLLLTLHFVASALIFATLQLISVHEILPPIAADETGAAAHHSYLRRHSPYLFLLNFAAKALLARHAGVGACATDGGRAITNRAASLYTCFSDAALLLWCIYPGLNGAPPHAPSRDIDAERQQHILAYNLLFFILVNLASYGLFTLQISARGSKAVQQPEEWDRTMRQSRVFSVAVVVLGWALSVGLTGLLPSLFTLCILLSGVSLNRFVLVLVAKFIRTGHKVLRNLHWLHRRLRRRHALGYALVAAAAAWVHWAYGARGVGEALFLASTYMVNITYKYQVQMTRKPRPRFFKHGLDFVVFGPLSLVLGAAIAKLLRLRQGQWAAARVGDSVVGLCFPGGDGVSPGCKAAATAPRPLFTVTESPRGLNISSVLNTMELAFANASSSSSTPAPPISPPYPFCGTTLHGLPLLHYALFSLLVYLDPTSPDFAALFRPLQTPAGGGWALLETRCPPGASPPCGPATAASAPAPAATSPLHPKALLFRSELYNVTLVAIQGTNPLLLRDLFQDVLLFHRAFTFALTAQVAPLLRLIPPVWTSYLLYLSVLPERLLLSFRGGGGLGSGGSGSGGGGGGGGVGNGGGAWGAWGGSGHPHHHHHHQQRQHHRHSHHEGFMFPHRLVEAVEALLPPATTNKETGPQPQQPQEQPPHRAIVLTGHSLGGSLAKIVAAATNVPVVGVSSPGVFLSARGVGVDGDRLKYLESNLVCENDMFPWLDRMQGSVFHLACAKPNPLLCHQPGQAICELVRACGGFEPRLFAGCRFVA